MNERAIHTEIVKDVARRLMVEGELDQNNKEIADKFFYAALRDDNFRHEAQSRLACVMSGGTDPTYNAKRSDRHCR